MANLSEMGFPWHLSIICCPHASFHSCKYHFCRAHVGGADLFYNLNFEYDSFTECAAFLIREGKAPSCFISQHQRIWISLWSGGSALKRQPVLLIVHCWRNCNLVWKLHTGTTPSDLAVNSSVYDAENWYFFAESWIIHSHSYLSVSAPVEITYYPSTEMFGADGDVQ